LEDLTVKFYNDKHLKIKHSIYNRVNVSSKGIQINFEFPFLFHGGDDNGTACRNKNLYICLQHVVATLSSCQYIVLKRTEKLFLQNP